jgi:hypothetical protein
MSRLGSRIPRSVEDRVDCLESLAEIQQLPHRYALTVDSGDVDPLVNPE